MSVTVLAALDPQSAFVQACYIVSFSLFIIGLRRLTHPSTARQGNKIAAAGMAVAVAATLLQPDIGDWWLIVLGVVIGTAVGIPAARWPWWRGPSSGRLAATSRSRR